MRFNNRDRKNIFIFFLVALIEHVFIVAIVAALIYSEPPSEIQEKRDAVIVTLVEKPKEVKEPPLVVKRVKPKKTTKEQKSKRDQVERANVAPPPMPKIKIAEATSSGTDVPLQLPNTTARIVDTGDSFILRSSEADRPSQRIGDILSTGTIDAAPKISQKPGLTAVVSPGQPTGKGKSTAPQARGTDIVPYKPTTLTDRTGPSTGVAKPGFVGDIRGEIAGRRVIFWPNISGDLRDTQGGTAILEILVDPEGNVIEVKLIQKSGSPNLDRIAINFVKQIRFEALPKNVQQRNQRGEILINFELARGA